MKTGIIWRESIYKNNFVCNKCGHVLVEKDGRLNPIVGFNLESKELYCPDCRQTIAYIVDVNDFVESGLQGNLIDFVKKTKRSEKNGTAEN